MGGWFQREFTCPACGITSIKGAHVCRARWLQRQGDQAPPPPPVLGIGLVQGARDPLKLREFDASRKIPDGRDPNIARKWNYLMSLWEDQRGGDLAPHLGEMTLDAFMNMQRWKKLAIIDRLWCHLIIVVQGNTKRANMVDPEERVEGYGFPAESIVRRPFAAHGYCFRCDTRNPHDVCDHGFKRKYNFNPDDEVKGTILEKLAKGTDGKPQCLVMWKENRDAFPEMTICVSRGMRGTTKFPGPKTVGEAYIYALKLTADKRGFDTERWQETPSRTANVPDAGGAGGGTAVWQPGEKAFYEVFPQEVMAYLRINKLGAQPAPGLFSFEFVVPFGSNAPKWSFTTAATPTDKAFLVEELKREWSKGKRQTVALAEDFYGGR
jgi:hypothetical protein